MDLLKDRLIDRAAAARLVGKCPRTIENWRAAGKLPEPYTLPNGRKAWRESELRKALGLE
jgi:predicted DNA-binding transcriptional regulator AlpA